MTNSIETKIKEALLRYGSSYIWVKNDIKGLTQEVIALIKKKNVPANDNNLDHAAYLVIDQRF